MTPLVSVIMATKNAERHLAEALASIRAQTLTNYEVIIVDGHSTDTTLTIAMQCPNVTVIQQSGVGFADAWNCGIKVAQGRYLTLLDSDDRWAPNKLSVQADLLEHNPAIDIVIGRVRFFTDPQEPLPPTFRPELLHGSHVARMPGAMMVRREVFDRVGLFDPELSIASDIDWFAKLKDAGIRESVVEQVLIEKRVHQSNLSYTGARERRYDRELLLTLRRSVLRQRRETPSVPDLSPSSGWPLVPLVPRERFVARVSECVTKGIPFAAGKLGVSEKRWLYYPLFLSDEMDLRKRAAYLANLRFHATVQSGIFPTTPEFFLRFSSFYLEHLRNLDSIGLFRHSNEREVVARHRLSSEFIYFEDQEPDRGVPADESNCYLPSLRGKRVLIISPFASLLCENATAERFEAVWRKTGKRWFAPASVIPLEFPYGLSRTTHRSYPSVIELYDEICAKMSSIEFDVALIGAASLNIPLVSEVKRLGRVGIALGGHLQVLFGVLGKRWRDRADWMERYVTEAWLPMRESYRPDEEHLTDGGAYW